MAPDALQDPLAGLDPERLVRAFALGSGRGEVNAAAAGADPLTLLALLAQRLRFGRPALPRVVPTGRQLPSSAMPITPRQIRIALIRLCEGTTRTDWQDLIVAGLEAIGTAGFRLHPFDLPRLAPRLAGKQDRLGPVERSYLAFQRPGGQDEEESGDGETTRDNWTAAPKLRRLEFIRTLRLADPDGARALIEQSFSGLRAPVRAELVGVLGLGLAPADRPFLEGLTGDRASQVREAVTALLARIPGTDAYDARLREALEMTSLSRAGLLGMRRVIKVEPPKLPEDRIEAALRERFQGVSLGAVLSALKVPAADLESLVKGADRSTAMCLLWAAFADGDLQRVAAVAAGAELSTAEALRVIEPDLSAAPAGARRGVVAKFLDLRELAAGGDPPDFTRLRHLLAGPLSDGQARDLLEAGTWKTLTDRLDSLTASEPQQVAALVAAAAALIPTALGPLLHERLEPLPPEVASASVRYAELLSAIARTSATVSHTSTSERE